MKFMSKAKVASKNNPTAREQAKEFFYNGEKVKPTKLVGLESTFFAAEYDKTGDLVLDANGVPLPWKKVRE